MTVKEIIKLLENESEDAKVCIVHVDWEVKKVESVKGTILLR